MLKKRKPSGGLGTIKKIKSQLNIGMPRIMSQWAGSPSWLLLVLVVGHNLSQSWSCCDSSRSILDSIQRGEETYRFGGVCFRPRPSLGHEGNEDMQGCEKRAIPQQISAF